MKHLLIALLLPLLLNVAQGQTKSISNQEFILKGKIIGEDLVYVHLTYTDIYNKFVYDSCYLKNGEFKFSGFIKEPTNAYFYIYSNKKSKSENNSNSVDFFLEPTMLQAFFKDGDFRHGKITGSKTQDEYVIYTNKRDSISKKWEKAWNDMEYARAQKNTIKVDSFYENQLPLYNREQYSLDFSIIKNSPYSPLSAYLLWTHTIRLTIDSSKMFYNLLAPNIQASLYGKRVKYNIDKNEPLEIGKESPSFSETDMNGKTVNLKDFRGQYVLLEFWASWCEPCRAENPLLKSLFSKYHDKGFTIIGVSLDRLKEKDDWLLAIKNDQLDWIQLCDFKFHDGEIINKYNLVGKGIPNNFLIDPKGNIVAKRLLGDDLAKKLEQLIN